METLESLSYQKTYWLNQLRKGNVTQESYDKILDRIETQEKVIKADSRLSKHDQTR